MVPRDLRPVDVVEATEREIGFETARPQDSGEGPDPGLLESPFPAGDHRLLRPDRGGEIGLGQPGDGPRLTDERSGADAG